MRRLSHYHRALAEAEAEGRRLISSHRLAEGGGVTSAQVRKDLSAFGSFGRRGLGYDVARLREEVRLILGLDRRWRVGLVGAGNVGAALLSYRGFARQGFDVVAVFDRDPARISQRLGSLTVRDVAELAAGGRELRLDMGVIATPAAAAQEVADLLVAAGVRGILNFAPRTLRVPPQVALRDVDMTVELESLSFAVARRRAGRRAGARG